MCYISHDYLVWSDHTELGQHYIKWQIDFILTVVRTQAFCGSIIAVSRDILSYTEASYKDLLPQ